MSHNENWKDTEAGAEPQEADKPTRKPLSAFLVNHAETLGMSWDEIDALRRRVVYLDQTLLMMHERCAKVTDHRDALARRCAEQARHIADLLAMNEEDRTQPEPPAVMAAIAVHQKQGVR